MSFLSGILSYGKTAVKFLSGNSVWSGLARTALLGYAVSKLNRNALKDNDSGTANIDQGVRLQVRPDATAKIPVLYGSAFFGGNISDAAMTNSNKTMWYSLVLAEKTGNLYSTSSATTYTFNNVYWNNQRVLFKADGITVDYTVDRSGSIDRSLSGLVKIYFYAGGRTAGQLPSGYTGTAPANAETLFPNWTSGTHAMSNLLFALVRVDYNREKNVTGIGDLLFQITSTMYKPGDVIYDYLTNTRYGAAINSSYVNTTDVTALNTYSDQTVNYDDQGTGAETLADRYQINGLIDTANPVLQNAEAILSACASWLSYDSHEGVWGIVINKADTSAASFDDSNIIGNISISGTGLRDLYNEVKVEFPHRELRDSADFYNIALTKRNSNEETNILNLTYDIINEPIQAQMLGLIELKQSRLDKVIRFKTDFSYYNLKAGDVIDVTNSRFGFTNEEFRIVSITEVQEDGGALVMEITALDYDVNVYSVADLYRFTRSDSDGIITLGSIGTPGTPSVTKTEVDARPRVTVTSTAPTGVVEGLEFWLTNDTSESDDALRSYRLIATIKPTGGGVYTSGTTVTLDYDQIGASNFYIKTRGFNATAVGPYSDPSGLVEFVPTQLTDAIGPNTDALNSTGGLLTALALVDLISKLDTLMGGDNSKSIFERIFEIFEDETGVDLVGDAAGGSLVVAADISIQDDGTEVTPTVASINVIGSGVDVTASGDDVTLEFTGLDIEGTPEVGQTIAWDGSNWRVVDSCCEVEFPVTPPVPGPCLMSVTALYPPDRTTNQDSVVSTSSDLAPTTGSYFVVLGPSASKGFNVFYGSISAGTGNAKLYKSDGTLVQTLTPAGCVFSNNVIEMPFNNRDPKTDYYIEVDQGFATYCECLSPAINGQATPWNFNTPAYSTAAYSISGTGPTTPAVRSVTLSTVGFYRSLDPLVLDTEPVCPNSSLRLTFNETVSVGTGNIYIKKTSDDTTAVTIAANTGVASGTVINYGTITGVTQGVNYYLTADAGIAKSAVVNDCFNISPSTAVVKADGFDFDIEEPLALTSFEVDSDPLASDPTKVKVNPQTEIRLVFNRAIQFGDTGLITIFTAAGVTHQAFNIANNYTTNKINELFWISGDTLYLNPTTDLLIGTTYYVQVQSTVIEDLCGITWNGISDTTTVRFTTDPGPTSATPTFPGSVNQNGIKMDFDREVEAGTGQIKIYQGATLIAAVDADDPAVSYEEIV